MNETMNVLYNNLELESQLIYGSLVGDKISAAGMCLDPHEAILEDVFENPFGLEEGLV